MPAIRIGASAVVLPDGKVLIWGGADTFGQLLTDGEWFDPTTGQFTGATPKGLTPIAGQTMTVLTDGDILVAGGIHVGNSSTESLALWHPASGSTATVATALPARIAQVATLLADGTVALTGGTDINGTPVDGTQLFDPAADTLTQVTTAASDSAHLTINESTPGANSSNNAASTPVSLRFSTPVDPRSVSAATVSLVGPAGPVGATVTGVQNGRLAFLIPSSELLTGSSYTIVISGVRSTTGQILPFTSIGFRTASLTATGTASATSATSNVAPLSKGATANASQSTANAIASATTNVKATQNTVIFRSTGIDTQGRPLAVVSCNNGKTVIHMCRTVSYIKDGAWYPGQDNAGTPGNGHWRLNVRDITGVEVAQQVLARHAIVKRGGVMVARAGATSAVTGVVKLIDGQAAAHVQVTLASVSTFTDGQGHFTLSGVPTGRQTLFVDGTTANRAGYEFGQFQVGVDVLRGGVTELPYRMYLPRILDRDKIELSSPTTQDMVITHPDIPGLEVHIPAGTVIRDHKGKIVTELAIVPTPVDRATFPVPENFPVFFNIEPAGATVQNLDPHKPQGIKLTYPNYGHVAAGTGANFIAYDVTDGWKTYGKGAITADATQLAPEDAVHLDVIAPASWTVGNGHPGDPQAAKPDGQCCGDPVDLNSGTLVETQTDAVINDVIPIALTRSWHGLNSFEVTNSSYSQDTRSFGGWRSNYDMYIYAPTGSWTDPNMGIRMSDGYVISPFSAVTPQSGMQQTWQYSGTSPMFAGAILQAPLGTSLCNNPDGSECYYLQTRDGTQYWFDDYSGLYQIRDRFGNSVMIYRSGGLVQQVTSPNGRFLTFQYDTNNNVKSVTDNSGRTWTYTYHSDTVPLGGWTLNASTPPSSNPPANTAMYFLDKVTYPDTTYTSFTYNENFSAPATGSGGSGQITSTSCPYYPVPGTLLTMIDRNGNTAMSNTYCSAYVTKQTLADGAAYQFGYQLDSNNNTLQTNVTDPLGNIRDVAWDSNSGYPSSDTAAYGTSIAQTTTYTRNTSGQVQSMTDALGRTTAFQYDADGNVKEVTYLSGTSSAVTDYFTWTSDYSQLASYTDALNATTNFTYTSGCLTAITDPLGHTTTISCNSEGLPAQVTDALGHVSTLNYNGTDLRTVTDALNRTVTFAVDPLGRMTSVTDPIGNINVKQYDTNDRITQVTDAQNQTTKIAYDNNGNPTNVTLPNTGVIRATYDKRNRRITRSDALNQNESWKYDGMGDVTSYTDRKGQVTAYAEPDAVGRFTKATFADGSTVAATTYDAGNRLLQITDSISGTTTRSYDGLDRLTGEITSQGSVVYQYYANGLRQSMTAGSQAPVNYFYDSANRLTSLTQGTEAVSFTYDNANRRATLTLPNGIVATYGYDAGNQFTGITYTTSGNGVVGNLGYSYDNAGRRVSATGSLASNLMPEPTTANSTFDLNNRQLTFNTHNLTYDADGNLTGDGINTYVWNARNQLTQIQQSGTTTASFSYDSMGRRTTKTIGGVTTSLLYDGLNPVQETQAGVVNPILTGLRIDERFARNEGSTRTYFLTDALGSTVALTNTSASIIQQYQYDPYGNASATASTTNPYLFTGRESDTTGLYYYRARYYSSTMAGFISEDPLRFGGGQTNFYAYANRDPISNRDPTGQLVPEAIVGGLVGAAWGALDGWMHNESAAQIEQDALLGAATGIFAGLTDGASLFEGKLVGEGALSALRKVGGMLTRGAINAAGEAGRQCIVTHKRDWGDVGRAGAGSVAGDFAEDFASAMSGLGEAANDFDKAASSALGGIFGGGVATAGGGPPKEGGNE
ncbi:RHS repeat-associated core domain-containing protein [Dyella dinghuensis]|nr:RHS repeat-associated core domain-containing protein [Dyella dinghuensis]